MIIHEFTSSLHGCAFNIPSNHDCCGGSTCSTFSAPAVFGAAHPRAHPIPAIIANQLQFICNASSLAEPHSNNPSLSMREKKGQFPNGHQTQQILLAEHASHCVVASSPLPTNGARACACARLISTLFLFPLAVSQRGGRHVLHHMHCCSTREIFSAVSAACSSHRRALGPFPCVVFVGLRGRFGCSKLAHVMLKTMLDAYSVV